LTLISTKSSFYNLIRDFVIIAMISDFFGKLKEM
jgi:hypothetical protein